MCGAHDRRTLARRSDPARSMRESLPVVVAPVALLTARMRMDEIWCERDDRSFMRVAAVTRRAMPSLYTRSISSGVPHCRIVTLVTWSVRYGAGV